jgi:hypothetical protein
MHWRGTQICERDEALSSPVPQQQAHASAQCSEEKAFRKKLPKQTAAVCAERKTHRDFRASRDCSRDQKISDVGTGNQEN